MNKQKLIDIFEKHSPSTPMNNDEANGMLNMMMSKDESFTTNIKLIDKKNEMYKHFKPLIESFEAQIFMSRISNFTTLNISLGALITLMFYMGSAGSAVMISFYLYYKLPENTDITIDVISTKLFPWGFFSKEQLSEIWNEQKVSSAGRKQYTCIGSPDNMIDYLETWKN